MTRQAARHRSFPTLVKLVAPLRWIGQSRRRICGAVLVVLALLASPPVWWATQLLGLPDIGDPFDIAEFRAFTIPDDRNAFVLYGQAATLLRSGASYLATSDSRVDWNARWSEAPPKVRQWAGASRAAMALYRQGADRPDALDASVRSGGEDDQIFQALHSMRALALLEASRLEDEGDMAGAWGWYRATLRTMRHVGMRGEVNRRNFVQRWHLQIHERLTTWCKSPRTTPAMVRRALDDVIASEALARSDTDSLKAAYLGVNALLDSAQNPGRNVPLPRFRRFWNPNYQLNPEQVQDIWDAWRFLRREPERSRRVIRLITANWLACFERPAASRPKPDPSVASFDFYRLDRQAPGQASALAPEAMDRWFDSAYDAQQVLQFLDGDRTRIVEQANHEDLLILLANELYRREHGTDPPTPAALVGPYLQSLAPEHLYDGTDRPPPVSEIAPGP